MSIAIACAVNVDDLRFGYALLTPASSGFEPLRDAAEIYPAEVPSPYTFAAFGYGLQPQIRFAWAAFDQLVAIVEDGFLPPGAGTQRAVSTPAEIAHS